MYEITKEVYFCYGHRLMDHPGKCRHIHGHSVKAGITVKNETLNRQDMVCDFAEISQCAEDYIEREIDHNFLVYEHDPILPWLRQNNERFMVMTEHPTAEILAKMIFQHMRQNGFNVDRVILWETASAYACYHENS